MTARKELTSFLLALGLLTLPSVEAGRATAAQQPTPAQTAPTVPNDGGWPRMYDTSSGARLVLYEPQIASWVDQKRMVLYAAVSYLAKGKQTPVLGTVRVEADTKVAVPERLVSFSEFTITEANFPTLSRDELMAVAAEINSSVPRNERVIGLDRVLAYLDTSQVTAKNVALVKADPPLIFSSEKPAVLVNLDGEPIWSPIKDNELRFAVNTNWDLFEYPPSNTYYLRIDSSWMSATNIEGPWWPQPVLPVSFSKLPDNENWKDVKAAVASPKTLTTPPTVFVAKKPAELILMTGAPKYVPVKGTKLLWVSNTDSDLFRLGDGSFYYLVSGRWFTAPNLYGPWTFATPNLPPDFTMIPLDHARSRVLASVPGTTQALEAVLLAQVPQTARVSRTETQAPDVVYDGVARFEPIEKTTVARAVNTDKDIIKVGDLYYMCFDGVWFMSPEASGPWTVADSIPNEIYQIPISSPSYPVTYVTVDDSDNDYVDFAAAAAYSGLMVAWGTAVWGTGYYYPPYWGNAFYPVYYPHYPSYGYGARYNPWTGAYSRGGAVYGPYGGAGYGARYNPRTGTYSRGAAAWGPAGARGAAQAWNPRTGTYAQTRQGANVFGSWGSTAVQRGDNWARTSRTTNRATGATSRVTQGSGGGAAMTRRGPGGTSAIGMTGSGNVYAGRDGNVYRKEGGSWQKYGGGVWSSVDRGVGTTGQLGTQSRDWSNTRSQLNRDFSSRTDGARRTRDMTNFRSGSGVSGGGGSYRPSGGRSFGGGGFRGGGGRR